MTLDQITIGSYNCSGLADFKKRLTVFSWLKEKNHQIFCLQETHSIISDEAQWRDEWEGPIFFSHGSRRSKGVMILFKKQLDFMMISSQTDNHGRWIILNINVAQKNLCLVNLYGPNTDEPIFFEKISDTIQDLQGTYEYIIVAGDYNTVLNSAIDRKGNKTSNYHQRALKEITNTMDTHDLVDIWRLKNPHSTKFTWRRSTCASRIDYFLISFSLVSKVNKVDIGDRMRSDHHLITLQFTINEYPRGPGYWKLNQSLLTDDMYISKTKFFITDFFTHNIGSSDAFKCSFRGHTIAFSSRKLKRLKQEENNLVKEIEALTICTNESDDIELLNCLDKKQKELERLMQERATNIFCGKKAEWIEKGNRCTKFFLNMQHKNSSKKMYQN